MTVSRFQSDRYFIGSNHATTARRAAAGTKQSSHQEHLEKRAAGRGEEDDGLACLMMDDLDYAYYLITVPRREREDDALLPARLHSMYYVVSNRRSRPFLPFFAK